jgi:hypothetical protein
MMPDQNEGLSQATKDAGALGPLLSKEHAKVINQIVRPGLELNEEVRNERASTVQGLLRARTDTRECFGWSSAPDQPGKLTPE